MAIIKLHFLDFVLITTMAYLIYDVVDHSNDYSTCAKPINLWLLAVYVTLLLLKFSINIVLSSDRLGLVKCCRLTLVCGLIPFLVEWTIQGTIWYLDISNNTPDCIPSDRLPPLIIWWIFVCYAVIIILFAILIYEICCMIKKRRVRALIQNYLNSDNPQRDIEYFNSLIERGDLSPDEIPLSKNEFKELDCRSFHNITFIDYQCSICCENLKNEEHIIKMFVCGHLFHNNCLEQWLYRKPLCPNCKRNVRNDLLIMRKSCSSDKRTRTNLDERDLKKELEEEKV